MLQNLHERLLLSYLDTLVFDYVYLVLLLIYNTYTHVVKLLSDFLFMLIFFRFLPRATWSQYLYRNKSHEISTRDFNESKWKRKQYWQTWLIECLLGRFWLIECLLGRFWLIECLLGRFWLIECLLVRFRPCVIRCKM